MGTRRSQVAHPRVPPRNKRVTRPEPLCGGADLGPEVVGPLLPGVDHHGDVGKEVVGCAHGAECRDRENNNP